MFKFVLVIQKLGFCLTVFYCFNKVSSQSEKTRSIPLRFISLFGVRQTHLSSYALHQINLIHRIRLPSCFSLFFKSFQGYFTVQLSRSFVVSCRTRQLLYIIKTVCVCQELFYLFFADRLICLPVARDSLYIISPGSTIVNNFFYFFHFIILPFDLLIVLPPDLDRQKTAIPTVSHSYSSFSFLNIFDF